MNHARHTFYISSIYKVNSLAYSTACSPPHWLAGALALPYRNKAEKYEPSIRTPPISWHEERGISFYPYNF